MNLSAVSEQQLQDARPGDFQDVLSLVNKQTNLRGMELEMWDLDR